MSEEFEFTEEQLEEFKEAFEFIDKEKAGTIAVNRLTVLLRALGYYGTEYEARKMMKYIEADENARITFGEFVYMMSLRRADEEKEIREAFEAQDTDGTGYIKPTDLRLILNKLGVRLTDEEIDEMIREADLDNDGQISVEEFVDLMTPKN